MKPELAKYLLLLGAVYLACTAVVADNLRDSMTTIARVQSDADPVEPSTASFSLRAYQDAERTRFNPHKNYDGLRAFDVHNELVLCTDGSAQLRAISLGSWQFDLDGDCADDVLSSNISVNWDRPLSIANTPARP